MKKEFHDWIGTEGFCKKFKLWSTEMIQMGIPESCPLSGAPLLRCDGCGYYEEKEWDKDRIEIEKISVELGQ